MSRRSITIHDGELLPPLGCPRGRGDCQPLSRISGQESVSFFCCGETDNAPVPTDRLRFCVKSTHQNGPVDILVNFDERDATHAAYALLGGLAATSNDRATREGIHG